MSDILDDYQNGSTFTDHLYLQASQVDAVIEKFKESEILYRIRASKNLDDTGFLPLAATTKLNRPDFVIQIPNHLHVQVDQLLEKNPQLLHGSEAVRTLFLSSSMDKNGWLEILIYPEKWEEGDVEIAQKLLEKEGIQASPKDLATQKKVFDKIRTKEKGKSGLSPIQIIFIIVVLLFSILGILNMSSIV